MINPGKVNSNLIIIDNPKPIEPPIQPGTICIPPIKIWLVVVASFWRVSRALIRHLTSLLDINELSEPDKQPGTMKIQLAEELFTH